MTDTPAAPRYYKSLGQDRQPHHGGRGQWPEPGTWLEVAGTIIPCKHGLHLCTEAQLLSWLGPTIWEVEAGGPVVDAGDKCVTARARLLRQLPWDERSARLFAADCAEHVLHQFTAVRPADRRPARAIAAARAFARGEIDAAARAAAGAAARDAAQDAARAAARDAAQDAAGAAARAAAGDAAWDAAWDAEKRWQTTRLLAYLDGRVTETAAVVPQ